MSVNLPSLDQILAEAGIAYVEAAIKARYNQAATKHSPPKATEEEPH